MPDKGKALEKKQLQGNSSFNVLNQTWHDIKPSNASQVRNTSSSRVPSNVTSQRVCPVNVRRTLLRDFCQTRSSETYSEIPYDDEWGKKPKAVKRLLVDDKRKFIYCPVPKAGSTAWKGFLMKTSSLAGSDISPEKERWLLDHAHSPRLLKRFGLLPLSKFTAHGIRQRLKHYYKFVIVRNPFDRLVSAYNDKMLVERDYRPDLRRRIYLKYHLGLNRSTRSTCTKYTCINTVHRKRRSSSPRYTTADITSFRMSGLYRRKDKFMMQRFKKQRRKNIYQNASVTFGDLVSYIVHKDRGLSDNHWAKMSYLCSPCDIQYDYIAKLETMEDDFNEIVNHLNWGSHALRTNSSEAGVALGDARRYRNHPRQNKTSYSRHLSEYRTVPREHIAKLLNIYREDMAMFGYDWDSVSNVANCRVSSKDHEDERECC